MWIAAAAWLVATPALAGWGEGREGGRGRRGPPPIERVLERHAERLGLDDAARARIRELARQGWQAGEVHRETLRELRDGMRALLSQEVPDEAAVLAQAESIGRAETELQKQRLRTMLAIRSLLSPEQRRELVRIHEERRAERRRGGEPGRAE